MKIIPVAVSTVVVVSVIAGFFVIGSPLTERIRRFDERRVNDLQTIQWEIINYWQMKAMLPPTLEALRNDISGFVSPTDPDPEKAGVAYEYSVEVPLSFSLCATFTMAAENRIQGVMHLSPSQQGIAGSWAHGAGRVCFKRTIDRDLYPSVPEKPLPMIQ